MIARAKDSDELTSGAAIYVADINLPGQLHAALTRSWQPHAHLRGVDTSAARALAGVVDVLLAADLPPGLGPIQVRLRDPVTWAFLQPVLATDRVRYVGEPVALVLAESRALAEDGAEAVLMDLDELPALVSAETARQPDGVLLFEEVPTNVAAAVGVSVGDVEAALAGSATVVEQTFRIARQTGLPMETRGLVASWNGAEDVLELWGITKVPHHVRSVLAGTLGLEPKQVRVREVRAGGGFGVRGEIYPEDLLVAHAAIRTGRPVKWIEDRREHLLAANHSRQQEWRLRLGFDADGFITGLDAVMVNDMGAYIRTHGTQVPRLSATELTGPYVVPAYRCRFEAVMTNKTPAGTTRSPGRYEASFVRERMLDMAAEQLGLDPGELRRRNFVGPELMPYNTGIRLDRLDVVYDNGDYRVAFDVAERLGRDRHRKLLAPAGDRRLGFGLVAYNEATGHGPGESAIAEVTAEGELEIETGAPSLGQGHETVFAEVAAAASGWPLDRVRVRPLDTARLDSGGGTWAARGAPVAAAAVDHVARELRAHLAGLAAEHLGVRPENVQLGPEGARAGGQNLALAELLSIAGAPSGLSIQRTVPAVGVSFAYGATAVTVAVDPITGGVEVLSMLVVADVGKVLNRGVVVGQIQGAAVQGIGGALLEDLAYSPEGQPLSTTFVDYLLPTSADVPTVEVHLLENHPSPVTPLGAKGAGEVGILGSAPAIMNAVADAIRPAGRELRAIPITPEDVLTALRGGTLG